MKPVCHSYDDRPSIIIKKSIPFKTICKNEGFSHGFIKISVLTFENTFNLPCRLPFKQTLTQ